MKAKTIMLIAVIVMGCLALISNTGLASGGRGTGQTALGETQPGSRYQLQNSYMSFDDATEGRKLEFTFKDGGGAGDSVTSLYVTFTYDQSIFEIDSISYLGGSYPAYSGIDNVDIEVSPNGWAMVSIEGFDPMDFDSVRAFGLWVKATCPPVGESGLAIADGASPPAGAACEFVRQGAVRYPQYRDDGGINVWSLYIGGTFGAESTYVGGTVKTALKALIGFPPNDTLNAVATWDSTHLNLDSISVVGGELAGQPYDIDISAGGGTAVISVSDNTLPSFLSANVLCYFFFSVDCSASFNTTYDLTFVSLRAYACPGHGGIDNSQAEVGVKVPDYKATINIRDVSVPINTQDFKVFVDMKNNFPVLTGTNVDVVLAAFRFKPQNSKTSYVGLAADSLFIDNGDTVKLFWEDDAIGGGSYKVFESTTMISDDIPVNLSEYFPIAALIFDAGGSAGTDSNRTPVETNSGGTYYHKDWKLVSTCGDTLFATNPANIIPDPGKIVVYVPQPPPGCPYLYSWDGSHFAEENTILRPANNAALAKPRADFMRLATTLAPSGSEFLLQIREFENEESTIDDFELRAVDHREGTLLAVNQQGNLSVYKAEMLPNSAIDQEGVDHLNEISTTDSKYFMAQAPGSLTVTYRVGKGFDWTSAALTDQDPPPHKEQDFKRTTNGDPADNPYVNAGSVTIEVLSISGEWVEIEPAERIKQYTDVPTFTPAGFVIDNQITVRYRWETAAYFDKVSMYLPCEQEMTEMTLPLVSCVHSVVGDVTGEVTAEDGNSILLAPNQSIDIRFANTDLGEVAPGFVREYIFKASGYYVTYKNSQPLPMAFQLNPNYPNPFNPTTTISYMIPKTSQVTLSIYNVLGQHVKDLVDRVEGPGLHEVQWDGTDATGSQVASGIYLYRIVASEFTSTRKMMLIK